MPINIETKYAQEDMGGPDQGEGYASANCNQHGQIVSRLAKLGNLKVVELAAKHVEDNKVRDPNSPECEVIVYEWPAKFNQLADLDTHKDGH